MFGNKEVKQELSALKRQLEEYQIEQALTTKVTKRS